MRWIEELGKIAIIALLPVTLFFYRDFDYYLNPALHLGYLCSIGTCAIGCGIYFMQSILRVRKSRSRRDVFWLLFSGLVLFSTIVFWRQVMLLQEIVTFHTHRDDFAELVAIAENANTDGGLKDTLVELPEFHKEWSGENNIGVFKTEDDSLRVVSLVSRPDTYYTYIPDYRHLPEYFYIQFGYGVGRFYELDDYWFICTISRD